MDKLSMQSTNGVQENMAKIQSLFPDCVTETIDERTGKLVRKVDFEKLQQNLSDVIISGREERYQFTWPDKKKAILLANSPVNAALRPCREESVDFDKDVTDEVVTTIAKMHPLYAVLRDTSMATDSTATNFEQLFKTYSPDTVTKIL